MDTLSGTGGVYGLLLPIIHVERITYEGNWVGVYSDDPYYFPHKANRTAEVIGRLRYPDQDPNKWYSLPFIEGDPASTLGDFNQFRFVECTKSYVGAVIKNLPYPKIEMELYFIAFDPNE